MRDRITHPKHQNDLGFSDEEIVVFISSYLWMVGQLNNMFKEVDTALGLHSGG